MFAGIAWRDALERTLRTFVQATAAAMLVEFGRNGAEWANVPAAFVVGSFAGFLALLMMLAGPTRPSA